MLSRISAEFESMDMAELVVGRVKQSVSGVLRELESYTIVKLKEPKSLHMEKAILCCQQRLQHTII